MAGGRIFGFIPFPRVLVLCEMQSVRSRIWTRVAVSISCDDNHYTTGTSLNLLCHSKTVVRFMHMNFIAYHSSKVSTRPDCIFEIHQLRQSGFSRVYSNCCCSCSFKSEIIKISQSSHKMYSNNIVNFQESTIILNAHTKKLWKLIVCPSYVTLLLRYMNWSSNFSGFEFNKKLAPLCIKRMNLNLRRDQCFMLYAACSRLSSRYSAWTDVICLHINKWFQVFLSNTNNSI